MEGVRRATGMSHQGFEGVVHNTEGKPGRETYDAALLKTESRSQANDENPKETTSNATQRTTPTVPVEFFRG